MHNLVQRISFSPPALLFFLLSLGGFAVSASARVVTVECDKSTISNALKNLDPQESNTVRVVGTCRDSFENIVTGVTANSAARTIILYGAVSFVFSRILFLPFTATMHRHSYDRPAAQSFRKLKAIGVHQRQPDEAVW